MKTVIGYLVQVIRGNGLYMFAFDTRTADGGMLMLPITMEEYHALFPAGEPPLNDCYEVQFEQHDDMIHVTNMFNLAAEVVPAELVPTLTMTKDFDKTGEVFMDIQKHEAALQSRLEEIRKDETLMADLETALATEQAKRAANIKERQSGKGIEALFTAEEVANFSQPDAVPVPGFDLSNMAEDSKPTLSQQGDEGGN